MAKILIIEDDQLLLKVYSQVLEKQGNQVTAVSRGDKGLNQIRAGGYDLILLDIRLPEMSGITILKQLKKQPAKHSNGPIVILSNIDNQKIIKQAMALGATSYILKDQIEVKDIPAEVNNLLDQENLYQT